jgi:hypothetical protein
MARRAGGASAPLDEFLFLVEWQTEVFLAFFRDSPREDVDSHELVGHERIPFPTRSPYRSGPRVVTDSRLKRLR